MNLTLPQMIGDFADLERRAKANLQGLRNVTPTVINSIIESTAQEMIADTIAAELANEFATILETQEVIAGPRVGEGTDPDDWESQVDDQVMEVLKAGYEDVVGVSYVGEKSVETRLHEPGRPEELAREIANHYAKELVKRDRETIHGFVTIDMEAAQEARDLNYEAQCKSVVLIVVSDSMGNEGFDAASYAADLDMAADDDDGLAAGALERVAKHYAAKGEVRAALKITRRSMGAGWIEAIMKEATILASGVETQIAASPVVQKERAKRKGKEKPAETRDDAIARQRTEDAAVEEMSDEDRAFLAEMEGDAIEMRVIGDDLGTGLAKQIINDPAGVLPVLGRREYVQGPDSAAPGDFGKAGEISPETAVTILTTCKEHLNLSEKALAEVLGISRATLNNIVAGKSKLDFTPERRRALAATAADARDNLSGVVELLGYPS